MCHVHEVTGAVLSPPEGARLRLERLLSPTTEHPERQAGVQTLVGPWRAPSRGGMARPVGQGVSQRLRALWPERAARGQIRSHHLHEVLPALGSGDTTMSCPCFPAHKSCKYFLSFPCPTKGIYQRQGYFTKGKETTCGYLVFIASSTSSKAALGC